MQKNTYLIQYRKKNNLTQRDLASILGVSWQMLSHIENGRRQCTPENAIIWHQKTKGDLNAIKLCPMLRKISL